MIRLLVKGMPVILQSIRQVDLEDLRQWKNSNRECFFFKDVITREGQERWYKAYLERADDFMFVILAENKPVGCIGFRRIENRIDVYNVILGIPEMGKKGYMGHALSMMCAFARKLYIGSIGLRVLSNNPAIHWYRRNGFVDAGESGDHISMELEGAFREIDLIVEEIDSNLSQQKRQP